MLGRHERASWSGSCSPRSASPRSPDGSHSRSRRRSDERIGPLPAAAETPSSDAERDGHLRPGSIGLALEAAEIGPRPTSNVPSAATEKW
jgi:hypothetical protein